MLLANQDRTSNQGLQENLHMEAILNQNFACVCCANSYVSYVHNQTQLTEKKKNIYRESISGSFK